MCVAGSLWECVDVTTLFTVLFFTPTDGSGELDLGELMVLFRSLGKNNITRGEAQTMMQPFDWRRVGRIDLLGFLEMMSPRRKTNEQRKLVSTKRMKASLAKQKQLSEKVPQARQKLEQRHANAALKRWTRKLGYTDANVLTIKRQFEEVDTDHSGVFGSVLFLFCTIDVFNF